MAKRTLKKTINKTTKKQTSTLKKIKTGVEGLDKMLGGGIPQGRNILLSGPCGTGKTTLAMQFVCNGAINEKEKGLYLTLEESRTKIIRDMEALGLDIKKAQSTGRLVVLGGPIAEIDRSMEEVDANITHIIEELKEVIQENNIKRVAIDSLNLITLFQEKDHQKRRIIAKLCNALSALGCTALLISETKEGTMDISRYGMEEFIVDGVLALYLVRQASKFVPGIVIRKMRGQKHDKEIRVYTIQKNGIKVYPEETMFSNF